MSADAFCRSVSPRYATVGGIRTHYVECGRGPTIVLIHGLSATFWNWWRNLEDLAQHFHVVAFDLKGCGKSAKGGGAYTTEACAAQLFGLLDHLQIERAALVGHSMGARVALNAALAYPERITALVLVSPSCYPQTAGRPVHLLVLPGIGEVYTQLMFTGQTEQLVQRALRLLIHPSAAVSDTDVYWNMLSAQQKRRLAHSYLRYGRGIRFHRPWSLAERYGDIHTPTLIISGADDRMVPASHPTQLARAIAGARLELWTETGHLPHTERAERFNTTVTTFLRSLPRAGQHTPRWTGAWCRWNRTELLRRVNNHGIFELNGVRVFNRLQHLRRPTA